MPDIPRGKQAKGDGEHLVYAVLGDSTAVGQGAEYSESIAIKTAQYLARDRQVILQNFGVSGARMSDVLNNQVSAAAVLKPDVVLITAGANDVTHLTNIDSVANDLRTTIKRLKQANPKVKILITGSPQMGSVPRFPHPVRYLAKLRTGAMNNSLRKVADQEKVTFAPIAEKTGPLFSKNHGLFAKDNFHPNADGYATWVKILNEAFSKTP